MPWARPLTFCVFDVQTTRPVRPAGGAAAVSPAKPSQVGTVTQPWAWVDAVGQAETLTTTFTLTACLQARASPRRAMRHPVVSSPVPPSDVTSRRALEATSPAVSGPWGEGRGGLPANDIIAGLPVTPHGWDCLLCWRFRARRLPVDRPVVLRPWVVVLLGRRGFRRSSPTRRRAR